jgi:hypothetical protein
MALRTTLRIMKLRLMPAVVVLLVACGNGSASVTAGTWLHCKNDACSETFDVGWYFPEDHGEILHVIQKGPDKSWCFEHEGLTEGSSWQDIDGGVELDGLFGIDRLELRRQGKRLDTLADGVAILFPSPQDYPFMTKSSVHPGECQ